MKYCAIAKILCHNAKHKHHPGRWYSSILKMQTEAKQSEETIVDNFRISRDTDASKWYIMQETSYHKQVMITWGHNHYRSDTPWHKQQPTS